MITESPLILTTEFPNATISIDIIDDVVTESAESFVITLSFQGEPIPRVTLDPNTTTITILGKVNYSIAPRLIPPFHELNQKNFGKCSG